MWGVGGAFLVAQRDAEAGVGFADPEALVRLGERMVGGAEEVGTLGHVMEFASNGARLSRFGLTLLLFWQRSVQGYGYCNLSPPAPPARWRSGETTRRDRVLGADSD